MSILVQIAIAVLEWLLTKGFALVGKSYDEYVTEKEIKAKAAQDLAQLKNAATPEEKQNALDQYNKNTFGSNDPS